MGANNSKLAFKQAVVQLLMGEEAKEEAERKKLFSVLWTAPESAEDIYSFLPTKDILRFLNEKPDRFKEFWHSMIINLHELIIAKNPIEAQKESLTKDSQRSILNCVRLLTRFLPCIFSISTSVTPSTSSNELLSPISSLEQDLVFTPISSSSCSTDSALSTAPPYQCLLDHLVRLMFFEKLTIPAHEPTSFYHPGAFQAFLKEWNWRDFVWQHGACSSPTPPYIDSRIDILRCFLVLLSKSMYFSPTQNVLHNRILDFFTSQIHRDQAHLLFFSWLRTVTSFRKSLVPYDYLFFQNKEVHLTLLCLQLLCIVLIFPNDDKNVFHQLLQGESNLDWLPYIDQFVYLLQARTSSFLLPGSTSNVFFYHEILIFIYIMLHSCKRFADALDNSGFSDLLVLELLDILKSHTSIEELNSFRISVFILSSLSLKNTKHASDIIETFHDILALPLEHMAQFYEAILSIFRKLVFFGHPLNENAARCIFNLFRVWSIPSYIAKAENNWKLPASLCDTIEIALNNKDETMIEQVLAHRMGLSEFLWLKVDKLVTPLVGKGKEKVNPDVWAPNQAWLSQWRSSLSIPLLEYIITEWNEQVITKDFVLRSITEKQYPINIPSPYSRTISLSLRYWLLGFFWGACYIRSTDNLKSLPLWKGTHPKLFQVKSLNANE